jgi:hypothetical protein
MLNLSRFTGYILDFRGFPWFLKSTTQYNYEESDNHLLLNPYLLRTHGHLPSCAVEIEDKVVHVVN